MGSLLTNKTKKNKNSRLSWFEIPVHNIHRAVAFYNFIYNVEMELHELNGYSMAIFPEKTGISGALVMGSGCYPSEIGTLVYLNAGDDLTLVISRVERAGGRVVMGKTLINKEAGHFALFIDTEGNKLALHSIN